MSEKCPTPNCEGEMFEVFFGTGKMNDNAIYKRCMKCNLIDKFPKEEIQLKKSK